jgi:hypothetical protein
MRVSSFWQNAEPGTVLCLRDGVYTETIVPPADLAGTEGHPITIRAEHDGQVLIDARHGGFAVWLSGTNGAQNDWFVVEGINAKNGLEATYRVSGNHNILRRVIGYDGTSGQSDSNIFRITGHANLLEDCAGWGMNARKIIDGAQAGDVHGSVVRRCWAEWNDWPAGASHPVNSYQMGYNTQNQTYENILGTTRRRGDLPPGDQEGVMRGFYGGGVPPFDMQGSKVLGALFYSTPGTDPMGDTLLTTDEVANLYFEDVAAVVASEHGHVTPWWMGNCPASGACTNNVCKNCLAAHAGRPASAADNAGWSFPGLRQGQGLAQATGGQSAFSLLPGLCKRYEKGQLTNSPLWPWPMNQRIKEARAASGAPAVDVTADVERILGPIPQNCRTSGPPPTPGGDTPPTVQITAPSNDSLVSGTIAITATAADDVEVKVIQFFLDNEPFGNQGWGTSHSQSFDTTAHPTGIYTLTAEAKDSAQQRTMSAPVRILVFNGTMPGPPTGAHPSMACAGDILASGKIAMVCQPQTGKR